jgi:pimeloyl-ACP methyl ester carboxylesterase
MTNEEVSIPIADAVLTGNLQGRHPGEGVVLFAHGSGSSRFSPRNRFVAEHLRSRGLSTLLVDLLTEDEERIDQVTAQLRFDIPMLADRLVDLVDWLRGQPETASASIGMFGASTGGGAALMAAADRPEDVAAVVSRGGRPDLAGLALPRVQAPTLLIVGSLDTEVIKLNRMAAEHMRCHNELALVQGATHLFEEPGTLEQVADLAAAFFSRYLLASSRAAEPHGGNQ